MQIVGLRLTCKGAKQQNGNQNEKSTDPKHRSAIELTDAARCRPVFQCYICSAVNQPLAPFDKRLTQPDSLGTGRWRVQNYVM